MPDLHELCLKLEGHSSLNHLRRGIEREALRVLPGGEIVQSAHPPALGAPLTHPQITTDFAEAQLEFITGIHESVESCLSELQELHAFVAEKLEPPEVMWPLSMPCFLPSTHIQLAQYGTSNPAQVKTIYRSGLSHRYGPLMQTISGTHYNFSFPNEFFVEYARCLDRQDSPDFRSDAYMHLIRNFRFYSWLLLYLFGASPMVCKSFVVNRPHDLEELNLSTLHLPYATSLRMGPLGYQSQAQDALYVPTTSLNSYLGALYQALKRPHDAYKEIGVKVDGGYLQLNDSLLQIEAEFYGSIRPKRKPLEGERPYTALRNRGIEYVEVRCLDLDPFEQIGISASTLHFTDAFLLFCLLAPDAGDSRDQSTRIHTNQQRTVQAGRDPDLMLIREEGEQNLRTWATEVLNQVSLVANVLDTDSGARHQHAVEEQRSKLEDAYLTPSGRIEQALEGTLASYTSFGAQLAQKHHRTLLSYELPSRSMATLEQSVTASFAARDHLESTENSNLTDYIDQYLAIEPPA